MVNPPSDQLNNSMPPRYPHGLKRPPHLMSGGEKAVFAALGASIGIGVYQLVTSPWGEEKKSGGVSAEDEIPSFRESIKSFLMAACPVKFDNAENSQKSRTWMGDQPSTSSNFMGNNTHIKEEDVNKVEFDR